VYKFTTADGREFKLGGLYTATEFFGYLKNVNGVKGLQKQDETIWEIYQVLDSLPNTKSSALEIIELIISWGFIAFIVIGIILASIL
jgi:hypothetical protein